MNMTAPSRKSPLYIAQGTWLLLIALNVAWDGYVAPLQIGRVLLMLKLLPLLLPLRGILAGRIYTFQYCSMLIMLYFLEGVMRWWDVPPYSRYFAATETTLSVLFFVSCLVYLKQFKIRKVKNVIG